MVDKEDSTFDDIRPDDIPSSGLVDAYSLELNRQAEESTAEGVFSHGMAPAKKAKPRRKRRGVHLTMDRKEGGILHREERWLPPGCMKEYFMQYQLASVLEKPAGFSTFWRAPRKV